MEHISTDFGEAGAGFHAAGEWQEIEAQGFLSDEFALWNRYVIQKLLISALLATTHYKHLAAKIQNCHRVFRHRKCANGHRWAVPAKFQIKSCGTKLCPHCAHRRGTQQAKKIQAFCTGRKGLRYVVLAERNSKNLGQGVKSLYAAWNSLRRSVRWKQKVRGSVAVLEVTYNKRNHTWHPHLNVLFEGEYFPFEELLQCWRKATKGNGSTAFIKAANSGTTYELVKYTLKVAEEIDGPEGKILQLVLDDPSALDEFLAVTYGLRRIRTYGTFRLMSIDEDCGEESEEQKQEDPEHCPDCGSTDCRDIGPVHPRQQLSLDFNHKVFRVIGELIPYSSQECVQRPPLSVEDSAKGREAQRCARMYARTVAAKYAA